MRGKRRDNVRQVTGDRLETWAFSEVRLIHVKPAIDLNLHRMDMIHRVAVMLGDETASIRLVTKIV